MNRIKAFIPWLIIVLGAALRTWNITGHTFWYDESFTYLITQLNFGPMLAATAQDVHPPLFYFIETFASSFNLGSIELDYRWFSLVCSVLSLVVFYRITLALKLSQPIRWLALGILAAAPMQIYYAQEARMYALLQLEVLMMVWAVTSRRWVMLELTILATLYTHNLGVLYCGIVGVYAFWRDLPHPNQQAEPWRWVACYMLPSFAFLPWFLYGELPQLNIVARGDYWIPPVKIGDALINFYWSIAGDYQPNWALFLVYMATITGVVLIVIYALKRKQYQLLFLAMAPWLLSWLISLKAPIMLFRTLVPAEPFLYLLAAMAIVEAKGYWRYIGAGIMVFVFGLCLGSQLVQSQENKLHDYYLKLTYQFPTDLKVVHLESTTLVNYAAYDPGADQYLLEAGCPLQHGELNPTLKEMLGLKTIQLADLPEHFIFVASVNPLTSKCQEDIYNQLIKGTQVITERKTLLDIQGIYRR